MQTSYSVRRDCRTLYRVLWLAALPLALAGCATQERSVGVGAALDTYGPYDLRPGDPVPNFAFIDGAGNLQNFAGVRGNVTAIVFPQNPGDWPNPAIYRRLAELADTLRSPGTPVVVLNVGQPNRSWQEAAAVLEAEPVASNRLLMVADREGRIQRTFGPNAMGRFFVVDNKARIVDVGSFDGPDSLSRPVRETVVNVADESYVYGGH